MFTEEELYKIDNLRKENCEFAEIIDRFYEEQQYMLSSITHELRNPLTLINSTIQLMERRNPEVKSVKYWPQLREDINDTISLLQKFSAYNHSDEITLTETNLFFLFHELADSFSALTLERNISISINSSENSYQHIKSYYCDSLKMKQAFTNVIKNAVEASPDNGFVHIDINADPALLCRNINGYTYMIISINNKGSKIDPDELKNIFKPFVTFKPCGSGMGLPIAYKIIANHNGTIRVYSDEELTCFKILLPLLT